jgi:hypothetical protein
VLSVPFRDGLSIALGRRVTAFGLTLRYIVRPRWGLRSRGLKLRLLLVRTVIFYKKLGLFALRLGLFGLRTELFGLQLQLFASSTKLLGLREALFTLRLKLFSLREGLLVLRERFLRFRHLSIHLRPQIFFSQTLFYSRGTG